MKHNVTLAIDGKRADIGEQSFILWNFAVNDASNPTIIKNSYTQQVTLPATPANNSIFGHIGQSDRIITLSSYNPLKKVSFAIYDEMSNKIQEGYLRLNSVTPTEYRVTLYGGLGEFFYNLSYNEDGTKKTLADLKYQVTEDGEPQVVNPASCTIPLTASHIKAAWSDLEDDNDQNYGTLLNFAPAYNGVPTSGNFHADKAIYRAGGTASQKLENLYLSKNGYSTRDGCGAILLELENQHTEWEMQDLRAYLQRPAIRCKKIIEALALQENSVGYEVQIGMGTGTLQFFNASNPYWQDSWMTLPLLDRSEIDPASVKLKDLLQGTMTPADFVIGYAKMCGLMFLCEDKKITIVNRNWYYKTGNADTILLDNRIAKDYELNPTNMPSRYLLFQQPKFYGEKAARYEEKYGKQYGEAKFDTGYSFDADTTDLLPSLPFAGAADVLESSVDFVDYGAQADQQGAYINSYLKFAFTEKVQWRLYKTTGGDETESTNTPNAATALAPLRYSLVDSYADFFPKVQLHGEENKAEDGSGVLLFFTGMEDTPVSRVGSIAIQSVRFHLSDDPEEAATLLDDEPCWDVSLTGSNIISIESIPSFRRQKSATSPKDAQWDFGTPKEYYTSDAPKHTLSYHFWQDYLSTIYNENAVRKTKKVDFAGIQVNADLLRNYYFFENAKWILTEIRNYSALTDDLVECEFLKVADGEGADIHAGQTTFI